MKINSKDLSRAVGEVMHLTSKRTTIPGLNCLKLFCTGNTLSVTATDLEGYQTALATSQSGELTVSFVPAKVFSSLIAGAGDEVELLANKGFITVRSGWSSRLPIVDPATVPEVDFGTLSGLGISCADLADGIESTLWGADLEKEVENSFRACVSIKSEPKSLTVAGTDGRKMAYFQRGLICAESSFMLNLRVVETLVSELRKEGATLNTNDNWVGVKHNSGSYHCRMTDVVWPPYERILPEEIKPLGEVDRLELLRHLSACSVINGKDLDNQVDLSFSSEGLAIESGNQSGAKYEATIPGVFDELRACFDIDQLTACLKNSTVDKVPWTQADALSPVTWRSGDTTIVLAVLRLKK